MTQSVSQDRSLMTVSIPGQVIDDTVSIPGQVIEGTVSIPGQVI